MIERIQFITNDFTRSHWDNAELACQGGIKWIQLRVKDTDEETLEQIAEKTQDVCVKYGAKLIINDHIVLAQKLLSDGVHLGLDDTPTAQAREMLNEQYILGGTANTFENIQMHHEAQVDYIGLGPYRHTDTKKNLSPILGLDGYVALLERMKSQGINTPIIAIGGIQIADIKPIINTGVYGIAISSLVTASTNPAQTAELLLKEVGL